MSNPTIAVVLSSLAEGTVPSVTGSIEVKEGQQIDVQVTWPANTTNNITCDLDFSKSNNQDPFNDIDGGDTTLYMTRPASDQSAVSTLLVENDATITTDTYDLVLTIDGVTYTKDPEIDVDPQ